MKHRLIVQERKSSLNHKVFGRDIPRTCGRISGRTSRPKKFHPRRWERRENKVFCADVLDLKAQTSMTRGQRTPWGGGKKRGVENLTNDTPPKKGFWTPPRTVRFPPPSGVGALFFLYKNPRQSRPEALLEGSKNFRESAFSGTFSSPPYVLHPPISRPKEELCDTIATIRSHLGTLALKTEDFSKKIGRFSKTQKMDLLKPSLGQKTLEKQGEERFSKSIFAADFLFPTCAAKTCGVCPVSAWVVGELWAADPRAGYAHRRRDDNKNRTLRF